MSEYTAIETDKQVTSIIDGYDSGYAAGVAAGGGGGGGGSGSGPVNTAAPTDTGSTDVGSVRTGTTGTWTGNGTITYAYQRYRDGVAISGATSLTYTLVAADAGTLHTLRVTATDADGSAVRETSTHLTRPLWHAREQLNAGLGNPTLSDPSSISSGESLDATGTFTCTLAPSIAAGTPDLAVRYTQEVKSLGESWTFGKLIAILRSVWVTKPTAGTDVWVGVAVTDDADPTVSACRGFGAAMSLNADGTTQLRMIRKSASWSLNPGAADATGTDSVLFTITLQGDVSPDTAYRYSSSVGVDSSGGGLTNAERTDTSNHSGFSFESGVWIHLFAGRTAGDGIAPNNVAETVGFRGLASLIGADLSDRVGVAP